MTTIEQSIKAMEKRVTKRANTYNKKVAKIGGKRSKRGRWSELDEKVWKIGSGWTGTNNSQGQPPL